ncbi:Hpt domain-containing protein [Dyella sp. SG609]|uniref:Hpt domain-containing protein n=1 Tax=Dyella sp. SG609 TaxID=2587018 RepID=UPI0014465574|nr:Hpt domain-containing protein [Dyella sp. SG609]NKJ21566.1 chemosensory pili system protein ChpA (sensor histidine kinase/response regulator) [Dyella sp. SG609]
MRLQDHIDFTTLQWVKPELDETLAIAREALESYVENPGDRAVMRSCADSLHQVQGTLRMVELYGAALVAEEMENLAIALLEGHVTQREEAYAAMMRGLMQLPDYLERLSGGHRDVPVVLLPLLNELRASRGQQALHESALFAPNLEAALPDSAPAALNQEEAERMHGRIAELRLRFQQQLLAWFRGQSAEQQLGAMVQTLDAIAARCYSVPGRRLWWITAGVLEGLQQGVLKNQAGEVRQLIGKVDRSIRQLIEQGEASMRGGDADELARKLLYVVAQSRQRSARMDLLVRTYGLDRLLPDEGELEHARGSMSGHNRALLDSVAKAIKEDLLRVKEALDLFLRQANADPAQLSEQTGVLERVGDTLGMLALGVPRRVVTEQRRVLEDIANRMRAPDEELLLDVAGALLYVEASLDDHIESLGADEEPSAEAPVNMLPRSEARHILSTLMQEATANTGKVKDAIVAFIESGWRHQELTDVPGLMDEVSGAMRMLTAPRPAELAEGIGRFVGNELLSDRRVPTSAQMDHLADALAALEYYLEAAREHRGGLEHILDVAEHSLSTLGYWPPPPVRTVLADAEPEAAAPAPAAAPAAFTPDLGTDHELTETVSLATGNDLGGLVIGEAVTPMPSAHELAGLRLVDTEHVPAPAASGANDDDDWVEIEEEVLEQVPSADAINAHAGFQVSVDGIDDEIREIFLEEMQEEIDNLRDAEQKWLADPERLEALTPIRRSFHTLKGSGRLVGASALGEYAWKIENMLNRVLDQSIPANANVQALIRHAIEALPQLRSALMGEGAPTAPLAAIMETADRLSGGSEHASIEDFKPAGTETVRRTVRRRVPRSQLAAEAIPPATLAHVEPAPEPVVHTPAHETIAAPVLPPVDPVLLEILRSEVAQYLQTIRHAINRVDAELRVDDGLLRAVHTLHGAIAMVDIPLLTQLLSPLESLLKRLRAAGHPLSAEGVNLLGKSADAVDYIMGQFDAEQPQLPELDALIRRLCELRDAQPEPQVAHVLFEPLADDLAAEGEVDDGALAAALDAAMPVQPGETHAPHDAAPAAEAPVDAFTAELMAALGSFDAELPVHEAGTTHHAAAPVAEEDDFAALYGDLTAEEPQHAEAVEDPNEIVVENTLSFDGHAIEPIGLSGAHPGAAEHIELSLDAVEPAEAHLVDAHALVGTEQPAEAFTHATLEPALAEGEIEEIEVGDVIESELADFLGSSEPLANLAEPVAGLADEPAAAAAHVEETSLADAEPVVEHEHVEAVHAEPAHVEPEHIEAERIEAAHIEAALFKAEEIEEPAPEATRAPQHDLSSEYAGSWTNDQIDPDLLEIFAEEAREILDHSDSVLAQWRAEPAEPEHMASLQRDLHTLKGGARIAGMVPVGDLTHAIETLLESPAGHDPARQGELIRALEAGFDALHGLVQRVSQGRGVEYPQAMIDRFLGLAGEAKPSVEHAEPAGLAAEPADRAHLPELLPEEGQFDEMRGPQEQIRVRSELLDTLVNHAGEVAIYRSRLEQQVAGYRFNLVELDQTVQRLRSQLRMLEIETEAQIIARFQREHREAGMSVFDPLELDRYSQLQQYSRALAESVSDLVSIQSMLDELTRQAETLLIQQSRVSSELQDGLLRTRMLPFDTMVPNLRRTLRQAAQEQGKSAQLFVEGAHGEMDRTLLDRLKAPFEHMLRNAVAHGIESPEERRKAGKPAEGAVRIRVAREATEVVVRVTDDGRGLDREAVRKRGIERGLLRADAKPSDDQLLALITQPGFSTASSVTQLAGRGVGMDVVANEIKQLGGSIAVESQAGQGTTFVLRLPFTLAVTQAILVRIGESNFAIPMTSVQGVARISPADLTERLAAYEPSFPYSGEQYGIHDLAELLGIPAGHPGDEQLPLLLTRAGDLRAAIRIDAVIGSREIVVKSVGPQVSSVPGILGATIMGDGSVLIILDLPPLVRHGIVRRQERLAEGLSAVEMPVVEEERVRPLVMVVDDSITMRKVTGRVLERHEYEVHTAKDGLDALEKLHERVPDLMLLDIEMPRMDGFELAEQMKADPRLRNVPIIMITSRTGDKHRQRAFDIGVDRYLGKPYQEIELLAQISEVLEQRALQDQATESAHG